MCNTPQFSPWYGFMSKSNWYFPSTGFTSEIQTVQGLSPINYQFDHWKENSNRLKNLNHLIKFMCCNNSINLSNLFTFTISKFSSTHEVNETKKYWLNYFLLVCKIKWNDISSQHLWSFCTFQKHWYFWKL
jgi:hypothetical protein